VSYVGYSFKEPWGEPRVVIGIDADEAEYLAEFLDRDDCAQRGQAPLQQAQLQQVPLQAGPLQAGPLQAGPLQAGPLQAGPLQAGPLQAGPLQQVKLGEPSPEGTGKYPTSALLGAPVAFGRGRQLSDQVRDRAAEPASWTSDELPGQVPEQLASWPPGMPPPADQPPASA